MKVIMSLYNNKRTEGSNSNSSRTSPSRLFSKNSLLAFKSDSVDDDNGVPKFPDELVLDLTESDNRALRHQCEDVLREKDQPRPQQFRKGDLSMAPPPPPPPHMIRSQEDENLDYDSNASFEFHRALVQHSNQNHVSRAYPLRQMPSKWNDAEKWIMSRQNMGMRKNSQGNWMPVRVVPEKAGFEHSKLRLGPEQSTQSNDLVNTSKITSQGGLVIRSVCMKDMGTEMTPIPSQEPSRSVTPVTSTTPFRIPASSLPCTPRGGQQVEASSSKNTRKELSEEEKKSKTRREIVALGVQLGKMNIAAWASKEEEKNNVDVTQKIEFEKRANVWEEAEKSKHNAMYKRKEIRIQAWKSREKAKLEAEMRHIEAKVEKMKAEAEAKMVKKIVMAKQISEEKRALAKARKARDAVKAVAEAECIRETGRIPTSGYKICCGWFSFE